MENHYIFEYLYSSYIILRLRVTFSKSGVKIYILKNQLSLRTHSWIRHNKWYLSIYNNMIEEYKWCSILIFIYLQSPKSSQIHDLGIQIYQYYHMIFFVFYFWTSFIFLIIFMDSYTKKTWWLYLQSIVRDNWFFPIVLLLFYFLLLTPKEKSSRRPQR